ncbi:MAG: hypothetical protein Q7S61_05215 [bacterium]|nr:hypothetical protein [bacterium]
MKFALPFFNKKQKQSYYFGIFLKETEVIGFAIEKKDTGMTIVLQEKQPLQNGWDHVVEEVDELLFRIENKLDAHFTEVIFFIYSHFLDETTQEIKKIYLHSIKSIVKELELKPLGYIECYEAVASYLSKRDEIPFTGILVELDAHNIGVFFYSANNKIFQKVIGRTDSITEDLEMVLSQGKEGSILPSKIILYDSEDLHTHSSQIVSHKWNENLFMHYPKVEILKPHELYEGLVSIFEKQIEGKEETMPAEAIPQQIEQNPPQEVLGFVVGRDIAMQEPPTDKKVSPNAPFQSYVENIKKLIPTLPKFNLITGGKGKYPFILIGALLIVGSLVATEYFFHKAKLVVFFPSTILSEKIAINGDSPRELNIKVATLSADFSEREAVSGKKDIGEKAKGEVTLHNFDSKEKIVSKNTTIETNSLSFVLNEDVKVASSSLAADGSARLPGKAKVAVTASGIGEGFNIDKGKRFTIEGLSSIDYFAINENAFIGGTKKQIRTVAKQDIQDLKTKILEKAKSDVEKQLSEKTGQNEKIISSLTEVTLDEVKSSKEIGEEADSVEVSASAKTTYYSILNNDTISLLRSRFASKIESGQKLDEKKLTYEVKQAERDKKGVLHLTIEAKGYSIKDVKADEIIKKITFQNKKNMDVVLKNEIGASGYELTLKPSVVPFNQWLPFVAKNIDVQISTLE